MILKRCPIFLLFLFISILSYAQDTGTDYWVQSSPEIRLNTSKFEFRYRPYETFYLTNTETNKITTFGRTDFIAGYLYKKFKFFVYTKFETRKKSFIGPRIDFNTKIFNNRVLVHGQYRYFWGLNEISQDHQYFITMLVYDTPKFLKPGFMGLNKHTFNGATTLFYGPSINFSIFKNISFLGSYMKDFNTRSRYFYFIRLNFKIRTK